LHRLGSDPAWYASIRERTEARRTRSPLYDMPRWTRHLELALHNMWATWVADNPRRDIYLTDNGTGLLLLSLPSPPPPPPSLTPRDVAWC
jgi:hypothetical protein